MKKPGKLIIWSLWLLPLLSNANPGDTTIVQAFTFDSIITRRAVFSFPEAGKRYEKILMYYTLKCDSLTPHDKYPCGEWDYTTYTRVYHRTGKMDSARISQPSFVVNGRSQGNLSIPKYRHNPMLNTGTILQKTGKIHCQMINSSSFQARIISRSREKHSGL
jgi:hypothetical protein